MALHAKVTHDGLDGQQLAIDPLYAPEGTAIPKHRVGGEQGACMRRRVSTARAQVRCRP